MTVAVFLRIYTKLEVTSYGVTPERNDQRENTHFSIYLSYKLNDSQVEKILFFFQAEDGIRDIGVTGVQTCALPICRRCARSASCHAASAGRNFMAAPFMQ